MGSKLSSLFSDKDPALIEITVWNILIIFVIASDHKVHGCKRKQCWLVSFSNLEH